MTIYEFFIQSEATGVRLEVPVQGLSHAVELFGRLDRYAESGNGRIVSEPNHPVDVEDLTLMDARYLLEGIEAIYVGTPGKPERGDLTLTEEALAALPDETTLNASYYEV